MAREAEEKSPPSAALVDLGIFLQVPRPSREGSMWILSFLLVGLPCRADARDAPRWRSEAEPGRGGILRSLLHGVIALKLPEAVEVKGICLKDFEALVEDTPPQLSLPTVQLAAAAPAVRSERSGWKVPRSGAKAGRTCMTWSPT